jgi:hypothetical protein
MPKKLRPAVDLMAFKCRTLKVKVAQQEIYTQGINDLRKKGQVSLKSQLQLLHIFLDKDIIFKLVEDHSNQIFHMIPNIN